MLVLRQVDFEAIRHHGEATYPHECCGVLLGVVEGERRTVKTTMRCGNTRDDRPRDRYNIDPREVIGIQRQGREQGCEIVGFYHSHPDCAAQWSKTDLEEAHWIGCSYVISRVDGGKTRETRSFVLLGTVEEDKAFAEEEILVEELVNE